MSAVNRRLGALHQSVSAVNRRLRTLDGPRKGARRRVVKLSALASERLLGAAEVDRYGNPVQQALATFRLGAKTLHPRSPRLYEAQSVVFGCMFARDAGVISLDMTRIDHPVTDSITPYRLIAPEFIGFRASSSWPTACSNGARAMLHEQPDASLFLAARSARRTRPRTSFSPQSCARPYQR